MLVLIYLLSLSITFIVFCRLFELQFDYSLETVNSSAKYGFCFFEDEVTLLLKK